jgi:hypothetical protein
MRHVVHMQHRDVDELGQDHTGSDDREIGNGRLDVAKLGEELDKRHESGQ